MEIEQARERFIEADRRHQETGQDEDWQRWQSAGAEYWALTHPSVAYALHMDANRIPTIEEIDQLAELVRHAMDDVPRVWRIASRGKSRVEYAAQVAWFHETLNALYRPFWIAYESLRRGDRSVIEPLVRFLEADPFSFRSGYLKERFIDAITQIDLGPEHRARLTTALLDVLDKPTRREFRHYVRLARYLDSPELRETLEGMQAAGGSGSRHARWILNAMVEGRGHRRFMGQGRRQGRRGPAGGRAP